MRPALRDRSAALPIALAAAGAGLYLLIRPASTDLAAHLYRAGLFRREGFALWDGAWYGGHHVPAYSILFPPLEGVLRPRLAGALSAVVAAALFAVLARRHWGPRSGLASAWFGVGVITLLLTGRLTFAAGAAAGLGSLLLWETRGTAAGAAGAVATGLASPVAGLFLALGAVATRRPSGVVLGAAALGPPLLVTLFFPEGGTEPFVVSALWPAVVFAVACVVLLPREERTLRTAAALYGLLCVACFVIPSPVGGNASRLGPLVAGPLAAGALLGRRNRLLAAVALPLLVWQWGAAITDVSTAAGDPSTKAGYYTGMLRYLEREERGAHSGRVEVPFTRSHWEAALVAPHLPLARGWERQLDRRFDPLFYRALTVRAYRHWLGALAVHWIALPDVPLDRSARDEARIVRSHPAWLRPVYRDAHWRIWAVRGAPPFASGAARVTRLTSAQVDLRALRPGAVHVRVRWTPYWALSRGRGCVFRARDGFTALTVRGPGPVRLVISFDPLRAGRSGPRCR